MSRSGRATSPSTAWILQTRDRFVFEDSVIVPSRPEPDGRHRFLSIGPLDGRLVAAVIALLGSEALSLISLRPAGRKERRIYEDA